MEAANIVPFHSAVRIEGDRIVIERMSLSDPTLAAFLGERPAGNRGPLVERALRIGLIGKTLVHYKHYRGAAPRASVSLANKGVLEQFLIKHKAVLAPPAPR